MPTAMLLLSFCGNGGVRGGGGGVVVFLYWVGVMGGDVMVGEMRSGVKNGV